MDFKEIRQKLLKIRNDLRAKHIGNALSLGHIEYITRRFSLSDIEHLRTINHNTWEEVLDQISSYNLHRLKGKRRIKVAFVLYSASMWSCDALYQLFREDAHFEPYIVVSRYTLDANHTTYPTFQKSLGSMRKTGYKIISVDRDTPKKRCYERMGSPDIVFYLTPYSVLFPEGQNEVYMPAKTLCVYIPYSYMLIDAEGKYNCAGMTLSWRHFCDSELYRQMLVRYSSDYERNSIFVGYPKMDIYYDASVRTKEEVWKLPFGDAAKCIIYAPHHSLPGSKTCTARFATFDKNYRAILEYARTHPRTTSWIVKPHPNLKMTVLETGFFKSEQDYAAYLQEWDALPNARVVEEATYYDIFKTSDAMVCDSVSFLAEYQFTGKPLLLLTRPDNNFNAFGAKIAEQLYQVPGTDIGGITSFIDDVVIRGNDYMAKERAEFFHEYLDYRKGGKPSASKQIFDHIMSAIQETR